MNAQNQATALTESQSLRQRFEHALRLTIASVARPHASIAPTGLWERLMREVDELEASKGKAERWTETAAEYARNADFYRGLLDQCAAHLGPEVYVSDDGSIQQDPLRLKIPELVAQMAGRAHA